jgi:hypothetical protein
VVITLDAGYTTVNIELPPESPRALIKDMRRRSRRRPVELDDPEPPRGAGCFHICRRFREMVAHRMASQEQPAAK